jgi:glycosyltransferase involved in cell wall biosynthesis
MSRRHVDSPRSSKTLVFFTQQSDVRPLMKTLAVEGKDGIVAVAVGSALTESVTSAQLPCRCLDEYLAIPEGEEIRKTAIEWLDAWADQPGSDGLSYKERVGLDGIGLWWFMLPVLIPDVLRCVQFVEAITSMVQTEKPDRILLVDVGGRRSFPLRLGLDDNLPGKIAGLVCGQLDVAVEMVSPGVVNSLSWMRRWGKARIMSAVYYACLRHIVSLWRIWLSRGKRANPEDEARTCVAVLSSPVYWRQTIGSEGEVMVDDAIAGSTARVLAEMGYRVLGIDVDLGRPGFKQFDILRQKRKQQNVEWRSIEYYQRFIDRRVRSSRREKIRAIAHSAGPRLIRELGIAYKGVGLEELLVPRFAFLFRHYIDQALEYMDGLRQGLDREGIALFMLVYEEGAPGRAATLLGQQLEIPTIALQHGALSSPFVPAYYMKSASTDTVGDPVPCPIPDLTAVYGEHMRSMLVDISSYPPDSVAVVGWPAYDGVIDMQQKMSREAARAVLQSDDETDLVLVVSQPFLTRENWDHYAQTTLGAAARLTGAQWAIKLHPSERIETWQQRIAAFGLEGRVKIYTGDLHQLLFACDAVVSWYSTVILEAALCHKPVISVSIPGCIAPVDYIRDGLVVEAGEVEDLERKLRGVLQDLQQREEQIRRAVKALGKYIDRPDGKASQRVADLVARQISGGPQDR